MIRLALPERLDSPRAARGLALVTVLWVLVLLSLIAASFIYTTRNEVNLARNLIDTAQAEALAEAGLTRALLGLLAGQRNIDFGDTVEKLPQGAAAEAAADPETGEPTGSEELAGEAWRADGTVYAWTYGGGELRISVHNEGGKIDLNGAEDALLRGLFLSAVWTGPEGALLGLNEDEAAALVDAVRDFADPDDLTRLNGAEDRDYAAAGLPWGAKDAAFAAVEELQQVLGVTAPLYEAVAPALTVHSGSKGVDARLAPREVLLALAGGGESEASAVTVDDYLAARAEAAPGAAPVFTAAEGQGPGGAAQGKRASRVRVYTIHAEARLKSGAVFAREAVLRLGSGQAIRIEAWRQGRRDLFPLETPPQ